MTLPRPPNQLQMGDTPSPFPFPFETIPVSPAGGPRAPKVDKTALVVGRQLPSASCGMVCTSVVCHTRDRVCSTMYEGRSINKYKMVLNLDIPVPPK